MKTLSGLVWTEDAAKCMSFQTITHQCGRGLRLLMTVTDVSKISALVVIIIIIICFLNFYEDFVQMSITVTHSGPIFVFLWREMQTEFPPPKFYFINVQINNLVLSSILLEK